MMASSDSPKELLDEIENEINNFELDRESFYRMKKVWIANEVRMIDDIDLSINSLLDDYLKYGRVFDDKIEVIRNLDFNTLVSVFEKLDFSNKSVLIMKREKTC